MTTELAATLAALALAALGGLVVTQVGLMPAVLLIALPLLGVMALTRPALLLYAAVALAVSTPYSISLGASFLTVFRLECLMAVGYLLLTRLSSDRRIPGMNLQDWVVVAYMGAFVASPALSGFDPGPKALINALLPISLYFAARRLNTAERETVRWVMLAGGSLGALSVLYELLFVGAPLFANAETYRWLAKSSALYRPGGVYIDPPSAAAVLSMCLAVAAPLYGLATGKKRLATALGLVVLAGTVVTFTRAPVIGLAIGAVMITVIGARSGVRLKRLIGIVLAALMTLVIVIPAVSGTRLYQQGIERPGQLSIRQTYWQESLPVVSTSLRTLLVGHGAEMVIAFRTGANAALPADVMSVPVITQITPHNQYVLTAVELGLSGVLLLVAYLLTGIVPMLVTAVRGRPSLRLESTSLAAGVTVVAAGMYAGCLLIGPTVAVPLALTIGMTRSVIESAANREGL